jgi:hypothetical protein
MTDCSHCFGTVIQQKDMVGKINGWEQREEKEGLGGGPTITSKSIPLSPKYLPLEPTLECSTSSQLAPLSGDQCSN